jgi:signal transduction histidine kinase
MPKLRQLRQSAVLRATLLCAFVTILATMVALTIHYQRTVALVQDEVRDSVDAEISLLVGTYDRDGLAGLADVVRSETRDRGLQDFVYAVAGPDNKIIAGNIATWPPARNPDGWISLRASIVSLKGEGPRWIEARTLRIGPTAHLLVGRTADGLVTLRQRFWSDMAWILLATGTTALLLGWLISRRGLSFISAYAESTARFHAGDLTARVPISARKDEFDHLGELINDATAETMRMTLTLRAATDSLAHDLKTPLTRLKSRIELAQLRDPATVDYPGVLGDTARDIDSLLAMIQALLQVVRAEATPTAGFVPCALADIVMDAAETYQPVAEDKGLAFALALTSASVSGSRALLTQAIANLIDNAIKYTPAGGSVAVTMAVVDRLAHVMVADSGPGIAAADRERVLERFVRLDDARSAATDGSHGAGLGLNLVSAVVRVHKGHLLLSDNHPGLRANLALPLAV